MVTRDSEKGTCMVIDVAIPEHRTVIKTKAEKILKYEDLTIEIQCVWNVKNKDYVSNNGGNWNHLRIVQKIPAQHIGNSRNHETTKKSHIRHCVHISESANVKVQNIQRWK